MWICCRERILLIAALYRSLPQALFLDRDGTLIEWVHYLSDPNKVRLLDGVAEALKLVKEAGCLLFLHTNQSGVGRGYFPIEAVQAVNQRMFELMGIDGAFFDGICVAIDRPDQAGPDSYRKPNVGFELEMAKRFGLELEECWMIGDSLCDAQTGLNAGMKTALIERSPSTVKEVPESVMVFASLADFVARRFSPLQW